MVGIAEPPKPAEIETILDFLRKYYVQYSMAEITKAFELYCAGKLPTGRDEPKHFNAFSLQFVGRVLNCFTQYQNSLPKPQAKAAGLLEEPPPLDDKGSFDFIVKFKKKNGSYPTVAPYLNAYRFIKGKLNLSAEARAEMKESVHALIVARMQLTRHESYHRSKELNELTVSECKRILVKKYIDENC